MSFIEPSPDVREEEANRRLVRWRGKGCKSNSLNFKIPTIFQFEISLINGKDDEVSEGNTKDFAPSHLHFSSISG